MGLGGAIMASMEGFMVFRGRSTRSEFWWFFLFAIVVTIAAAVLEAFLETKMISIFVNVIFFMPLLAVTVRRLHDTNRSVIYLAILLLPVPLWFMSGLIGDTVWAAAWFFAVSMLLLILCLPGQIGANKYGPDPYNAPDLDAF